MSCIPIFLLHVLHFPMPPSCPPLSYVLLFFMSSILLCPLHVLYFLCPPLPHFFHSLMSSFRHVLLCLISTILSCSSFRHVLLYLIFSINPHVLIPSSIPLYVLYSTTVLTIITPMPCSRICSSWWSTWLAATWCSTSNILAASTSTVRVSTLQRSAPDYGFYTIRASFTGLFRH